MPLSPTWTDIAICLALTLLARSVIGLNRCGAQFLEQHPNSEARKSDDVFGLAW